MAGTDVHDSEMVFIYVGPSQQVFAAQERTLKEHSTFFHAALKTSGFKEATTQTIYFPELDTQAFAAFIEWMTTGEIFATGRGIQTQIPGWERREILTNLYVLADYLDNLVLQNKAMTGLVELEIETNEYPDMGNICVAYEQTLEGSPLRQYVLNSPTHGRP